MTPDDSNQNLSPDTTAIVEKDPQTSAIVETDSPADAIASSPSPDPIQQETEALIDAIRKRALAEAQAAGEFTRDTYLNAVRQTRESIEQHQLIDPERMEASIQQIQLEAEKNWHTLVSDVQELGDRLSEAAKAAWDILMGQSSRQ